MRRLWLLLALISWPAAALDPGEEVDLSAGAITALSCALQAQKTGDLTLLGACPLVEAKKEIVVFDVAERQIYRLSRKKVFRYQLEKAFGGGSIDLTGKVLAVDPKDGVATVEVEEYSITSKPKPGAFKGCL